MPSTIESARAIAVLFHPGADPGEPLPNANRKQF
jgi:hypothetical protein